MVKNTKKSLAVKNSKITFSGLVSAIRQADHYFSEQANRAVNISLTLRNWAIGYYIAHYELYGADRANYGKNLFVKLSKQLQSSISNSRSRQLYYYTSFYRAYPKILRSVTAKSQTHSPIGILLCTKKDHALAEYALAGMNNKLFISKYQVELPKKKSIEKFLETTLKEIE